jgi:predicted metalloprotease
MEFDDSAQLDTSQISDQRSGGMMSSIPGGGLTVGGGGLGIVGLLIVLLVNALGGGGGGGPGASGLGGILNGGGSGAVAADNSELQKECRTGADANRNDTCANVAVVNSVQAFWTQYFARHGQRYVPAKTVFFRGATRTGCGQATTAVGPFYCPADRYVYIDLGFYDELRGQLGATGGRFAEAYVLAHEYGHHIQDLLGTIERVDASGDRQGPDSQSVRLELQADCLAGVWAKNAAGPGKLIRSISQQDIADGLNAAAAVGDDRIQQETQGRVNPESWTHGSSAERQHWFTAGYRGGTIEACDTFSGAI